ncbi:MAG: STAS domain-containing protein [Spirochaetota bacterium]
MNKSVNKKLDINKKQNSNKLNSSLNISSKKLREANRISIIKLDGSINVGTYSIFHNTMISLLKRGTKKFILDCENLNNVNSLAINSIIDIMKNLNDKNSFRVVKPNKKLTKLINVLKLQNVLLTSEDIGNAIKSIRMSDR